MTKNKVDIEPSKIEPSSVLGVGPLFAIPEPGVHCMETEQYAENCDCKCPEEDYDNHSEPCMCRGDDY